MEIVYFLMDSVISSKFEQVKTISIFLFYLKQPLYQWCPTPGPLARSGPQRSPIRPAKGFWDNFLKFSNFEICKKYHEKIISHFKIVHQGDGAPKMMFIHKKEKWGGGGVWPAKTLENANPAREQKGLGITGLR